MVFEVEWTENAREDFWQIVYNLETEWSKASAEKFTSILYEKLHLISHSPLIGISSLKFQNVHRILITKHNALYYRIEGNKIILLDLFDLRQDSNQNPFD